MIDDLMPTCMSLTKQQQKNLHFGVPNCLRMGKHDFALSLLDIVYLFVYSLLLQERKSVPRRNKKRELK